MVESGTRFERVEVTTQAPGPHVGRSIGLHAVAAAVMYVSPLLLFVPAAYLSAGIRHGRKGLAGSVIGSGVVLLLLAMIVGDSGVSSRDISGILRLVMTIGLPSAVAWEMISMRRALGPIVVTALLVSIAGFFGAEVLMRAGVSYSPWTEIITEFESASQPTIDFYRSAGVDEEALAMMSRFSETLVSTFVPSVLLIITALMFVFSLMMIPRLPWGREVAPQLLLRHFALPEGVLFGFVLAGLSPLAGGVIRLIGLNALAVILFLYLLQGLGVFRAVVLRMKMGTFGNVAAWALLGITALNGVAPFLLFLAGLFDPFFNFRNFKGKGEDDESSSD